MIRAYRKVIVRLSILLVLAVISFAWPNLANGVPVGCGICNGQIICPPHGECVTCFPNLCLKKPCTPFQICNNAPQPNPTPPE